MDNNTPSQPADPRPDTQSQKSDNRRIHCEVYSRVCGYLRPTQDWNVSKRHKFGAHKAYRPLDGPASAGAKMVA